MSIVDHGVASNAQLRLLARRFAQQPGSGTLMRGVAAQFAVEITGAIVLYMRSSSGPITVSAASAYALIERSGCCAGIHFSSEKQVNG